MSPDNRNLNYEQYYESGNVINEKINDYNSHNTTILKVDEIIKKLLSIDYVNNELSKWKKNIK